MTSGSIGQFGPKDFPAEYTVTEGWAVYTYCLDASLIDTSTQLVFHVTYPTDPGDPTGSHPGSKVHRRYWLDDIVIAPSSACQ